ncbi:hypothetical protein Dimus_022139 [Dionaea muscipula]
MAQDPAHEAQDPVNVAGGNRSAQDEVVKETQTDVAGDLAKEDDDDNDDHGDNAPSSVLEAPVQPEIPTNTDAPAQEVQLHEVEQEVEQETEEKVPDEHHEQQEAKSNEDLMEKEPQTDEAHSKGESSAPVEENFNDQDPQDDDLDKASGGDNEKNGVHGETGICEYIKDVWEPSKCCNPLEITRKFANDQLITAARKVKSTEMKPFQRRRDDEIDAPAEHNQNEEVTEEEQNQEFD